MKSVDTSYNKMFAQGCLEESFWGLASWNHIPSLGASNAYGVKLYGSSSGTSQTRDVI